MKLSNGEKVARVRGKLVMLNLQVHDLESELNYLTRHRRAFDKQVHPKWASYDDECSTCGYPPAKRCAICNEAFTT